MGKVSIIMPVYNAEKYLSEAIESVLKQTYPDFELLLINDRSTDNSREICREFAKKDARIVLLENNTEIHGPGPTRNIGLDHATGEYIYFMDADDWIEKDLLQDTVALAEKMNADIVPFGFVIEDSGKKIRAPLKPSGNYKFEDFKIVADEIIRGTWSECHELIRNDLLGNIRHNKLRVGEDICFQMDLLCSVKKVSGIDKEYYHYRVVEESVSHSCKWDDMLQETSIAIWEKEKQFLAYCGLNKDSQIMKNAAMERYTACIYEMCHKHCPLSLKEKYKLIRAIGNLMEIQTYKYELDCNKYLGIRKMAKILVKYNLEMLMIFAGTLFFKIFERSKK